MLEVVPTLQVLPWLKIELTQLKHPQPYKLQWLNTCGGVKVTKQVIVSFSIGKYKDEFLCDIVPMQIGHIFWGDHGNSRDELTMMKLPINTYLDSIERPSCWNL